MLPCETSCTAAPLCFRAVPARAAVGKVDTRRVRLRAHAAELATAEHIYVREAAAPTIFPATLDYNNTGSMISCSGRGFPDSRLVARPPQAWMSVATLNDSMIACGN